MSRLIPLLSLLAVSSRIGAQDLSADQIVARHLEARGGAERLKAVTSVIYRNGAFREGSFVGSGRAFMAMARPYYKVVGDPTDPASQFREGYDGSAWEWYPSPGFVVRTVGPANAAIRHNLDPEGPFSDYRAKGTIITRVEDADVAGRPAFGIELTLRDGFREVHYIDRATFLVVAVRKSAPIHAFGAAVATETLFSHYRSVAGILFPFRASETEIASGKEISSMVWGTIEINREIPREWFSPPQFERNALQEFLEHLYFQRSDTAALRWSYAGFRRAHPAVDTRAGAEAIGYQMLKMNDHDGAILVLLMNAHDYPSSSSAAFGLGRAYASAGDTTRATHAFQRAVELDSTNARAVDALRALRSARAARRPSIRPHQVPTQP